MVDELTLKPKNTGSKILFKNKVIEKLSRTHVSVPIVTFFIYGAGLLYWSVTHTSLSLGLTTLMFFVGFIVFTWVEYLTHRYIFHMSTVTTLRAKIQYMIHGVHHEYPKDKDRLAMPPVLSITIATSLLFLLRMVLGDLVFSFLPGFLVGYALYLLMHYLVHVLHPPKNFFRVLWINHSVHHYKEGKIAFGVSSPFWDYVYGTMYRPG